MSGGDLDAVKAAARTEAYARRKAAKAAALETGLDAGMAARDQFFALAERTPALAAALSAPGAGRVSGPGAVVSGYRPIRTEIDPTPLMLALIDRGLTLCVPVVDGPARPLSFRPWTPDAPMTAGAFGAEIPVDETPMTPSLLIAPLLAFDAAGYRLGYGGGFYDRTLAGLRAARPTLAVGLAFAGQAVAAVPRDGNDQPLDALVTEADGRAISPVLISAPAP